MSKPIAIKVLLSALYDVQFRYNVATRTRTTRKKLKKLYKS